jgi:5-methylcytosine-specific restriction endonuclease McrA
MTQKEYQQQWYLKNRERLRIKHKARYWANREKVLAQNRQWYEQNRDRKKEYDRIYAKKNQAKLQAYRRKYGPAYREKNGDLLREKGRAYYAANKEARKAYYRAYYAKNRDRERLRNKAKYEADPDGAQARWRKRRATIAGAGGTIAERDWLKLISRYDGLCAYCQADPATAMDHVIPVSRGGRHTIGNVLPACQFCNSSKGTKLLIEWRERGL